MVSALVHQNLQLYAVTNDRMPPVSVAAALFQRLTYTYKDVLTAGIILAGYDEKNGGEVYSIPLGGSLHKQDYTIAGSGSTYIYGFCDKNFRPDFTREEGINFVKQALSQAIKWDGSSGGVIRIVIVTKDATERLIFYPDEYEGA